MSAQRILAVPNNISSVERYFHFLMGYFVPLVWWIDRTGTRRVTVRDCGPMNAWFDLLRPSIDVEVIPAGQMLKRYVTRSQRRVVLPQFDNPALFHRPALHRVATVMRDLSEAPELESGGILIVRRRPSHPYYGSAGSEVQAAGSDLRSIPNVDEFATSLAELGSVVVIDAEEVAPVEQIRQFAAARILVGQHGAGLANMIWMRPGGAVVEIQPPVRPIVSEVFADLADALGLGFQMVEQTALHDPVAPPEVLRAVATPPLPSSTDRGVVMREARRRGKSAELRLQQWPVVGPLTRAARHLTGP